MRIGNTVQQFVLGAALLLGATGSGSAAGNVSFDINYIDQCQEISPKTTSYQVDQHVVVTLHDGNRVTEQRNWRSPGAAAGIATEGAMGSEVSALKFTIAWHVQSPSSLIRYRTFPQHVEVLHIAVSGQSCEVTIQHKLKPGFTTYERFDKQWASHIYSSLASTGITCRVSQ